MALVNVSKVLSSPRVRRNFVIYRKAGTWQAGRFVQQETAINFSGVVIPGGTDDIIQVPEGDRTSQLMVFISKEPMYITNETGTSDEAEWKGERYKIHKVMDWDDFGYYRAIGTSMRGD